jgi:anti-sigma regulatory factor (Ser/Thr protein kinase)
MARIETAPGGDLPLESAPRHTEVDLAYGELTQVVLPADLKAPFAARALLALCLRPLLGARALGDAQLLVSEMVTNSLLHGALGDREGIVVRMQLGAESLRLEVHNPGMTGTVASNDGAASGRRGFGLDLVCLLGARWGVRRDEDTCVWVEMARA